MFKHIYIGLDDIDTYQGGCTTHFSTYIVEKIFELKGSLVDYPKLIRLNPDTPWKTRGNGAVSLEAIISKDNLKKLLYWIKNSLIEYLEQIGGHTYGTQPSIIILDGNKLSAEDYKILSSFSLNALYRIISLKELNIMLQYLKMKNAVLASISPYGSRGLIGALSAIGNPLSTDYTYEFIIYRTIYEREKKRKIHLSVFNYEIEDEFSFAHIDLENRRLLLIPHGPDPVIAGIRGSKLSSLFRIFYRLFSKLHWERWLIFVTNQGTNQHFKRLSKSKTLPYTQLIDYMKISKSSGKGRGGHIRLFAEYNNEFIHIMVYEQSGRLRDLLKKYDNPFIIGVGGGIKSSRHKDTTFTLNTQILFNLNSYISDYQTVKPVCPKCFKEMESLGKDVGYRCKSCKYHIKTDIKGKISKTRWHPQLAFPPYRSTLHLSKPLKRYGREKRHRLKGIKNRLVFMKKGL